MARILVPRGSSGSSSSNPSRSSLTGSSSARIESQVVPVPSAVKDKETREEVSGLVAGDQLLEYPETGESKAKSDDLLIETFHHEQNDPSIDEKADVEKVVKEEVAGPRELMRGLSGIGISERLPSENEASSGDSSGIAGGSSLPPPPPVPPPRPSAANLNSRRNMV